MEAGPEVDLVFHRPLVSRTPGWATRTKDVKTQVSRVNYKVRKAKTRKSHKPKLHVQYPVSTGRLAVLRVIYTPILWGHLLVI